ncbi:uncharacterized protein PAE49_000172 [Odontesthes bonariensis]
MPLSLAFSNKGTVIYWADAGEKFQILMLMKCCFSTCVDVTKLWFSDSLQPKQLWFETKTSVVEVRAYNNDSQSGVNNCSNNNGGCVQLCLPYPGGRTCKCGRGFHNIGTTSCAPLPPCPAGEESCFDGSKCISSTKFCDGRIDCLDRSDEHDCPTSNSLGTKIGGGRSRQSPLSLHPNYQKNSVPSDQNSAPCDLKHCSGHGTCITEGKLTRCQCAAGYKGEFCQEKDGRKSHPAVILGSFSLVAAVIVAVFALSKRKGWKFRSKSADKETLLANMRLPAGNDDSDTEELETSVDVRSPLRSLKSLRLK